MTNRGGRQPTLMAVHAHPDDEASQTGGTLAKYSAAGWRTVVVTCTDGAQGDGSGGRKSGDFCHRPEEVSRRRSYELSMSRVALGISDLIELKYPDSGTSGLANVGDVQNFAELDGFFVAHRIEALMRDYEPDVIITYPPNGFSCHPDHIQVYKATVAAFRRICDDGGFSEFRQPAGVMSFRLPRLYYIAISETRLRHMRLRAADTLEADSWVPPLASEDSAIQAVVDVSGFWREKMRALAAHASQSGAASLLRVLDGLEVNDQVEEYLQAFPSQFDERPEKGLLGGLLES
ncbi:PIG-L deacetylase family protein [Streptomyces sp. NPDC059215]|uniref:PIG-L deacetylase family protein n=1 Tax=Streptomyces sp. NPDC059215 TaxID=3346772 RepID=UPI0036A792B5